MPVYNRSKVIGRAIQSVLDQEFEDFELIVVDDGSSDGSAEIVEAIADNRIRLIRQPSNRGGNAARNLGIREARAPLVAFLDSDDWFQPNKLRAVSDFFAARAEIDVLVDSFIKTYPTGSNRPDTPRPNPVIDDNEAFLEALFGRDIWKATPGISARREALERAGMFDETLRRRQDYDLLVRLAKVARCASTDQLLWVKTNSADAISANDSTFLDSILEFAERHPEYLSDPRFHKGFALDLARYFNRIISRRRFNAILPAVRRLSAFLGPRRFAGSLIDGYRLMIRRKRRLKGGGPLA